MGPVCPADGVCVRWGWASWPGLQCQDPTLFCPSTSPNSCVLRPPSPTPRSPNVYETGVGGGKAPHARLLPQPLQLRFLTGTPDKSVDTADTISDLAKISVRQSWAQAAWLSKVILGAPHCSLLERGRGRLHCQLGVAVLLATGSWAEGLALQVNLLTWWLWLAVGGRGPSRSSEKLPESGHKGCNHFKGRAEGAAGWAHGESRATSPAQLHQPPWGAHLWWGKLSWASPHHPLQGQPLANGSRYTNSTWPVQGGFLH